MACCKGQATWFCTYPDSGCGHGACGTCNSSSWQFAWPSPLGCAPCGTSLGCGTTRDFTNNCSVWNSGARCDTGPACSTGHMVDFTKSLFMEFAPLSQGVISNMRAASAAVCC